MYGCDDPYGQERKGRDAALWGERHDHDHVQRMRIARWEPDSCAAHYARGYDREIEHQREVREEAEREEERRDEERREQTRAEQARLEQCWADEEREEEERRAEEEADE